MNDQYVHSLSSNNWLIDHERNLNVSNQSYCCLLTVISMIKYYERCYKYMANLINHKPKP